MELRNTGKTQLSLIYDAKLSRIDGQVTLIEKDIRVPLIIDDQVVQIPVVHASGTFTGVGGSGTGDFYFLDNKNNPMMIQSTIQFSFEKNPRTERIVRVAAGASMRSAMEQSLSTLRRYDLYGIHFDFDKARMRPESAALIKDIALTLRVITQRYRAARSTAASNWCELTGRQLVAILGPLVAAIARGFSLYSKCPRMSRLFLGS